ncbi:FAD-dependent oxidoreductase [Rhodococcus sp. Q]|uniref:NAD(P)/FAD-dependent oxidoreductase n=1 Tax=Rhodococcus sp. Q TaxID=2502252 RepID=UPI0010F59800|nr:FAD-dependent oxidoreductase [Rhodococcus sp. Q]
MTIPSAPPGRSVAVIGSGVAGLTAAYVLAKRDRVILFEADSRLGGHAHTHDVDLGDGRQVPVDTGFIVHNDRTYPTLCALFDELGVATQPTDMSMSVRSEITGVEYAGAKGISGLFPTARSLTRGRHLRMLGEVVRFHRAARALLDADTERDGETLGSFLDRLRFSRYFADHFMTPLVAAVWSCDPAVALRYPARYLLTFLDHHGMLTVFGSPPWRTVTGGSARYVEKVASTLHEVRTGTPVQRLERLPDGVRITANGEPRRFDAAVVAVHPHQALRLLDYPTTAETDVLGAITYSTNMARLHTDSSLLPRAAAARASWNYLIPGGDAAGVVVTYDMSRLMRLNVPDRRFLVTLGGGDRVDPATVIAEMTYEHPLYTPESVAAQRRLPELGTDTVAFAGAYHGWGFHEDGAAAGLRAAQRIGAAAGVLVGVAS